MVSIIVPAYNAEKYLDACVGSIVSQSYGDWELLLIDDGSTDGTVELCDDWGRRDDRIRVIHQANRGVSAARNRGLDDARGNWIAFLDADDVLAPEFLSHLVQTAVRTGAIMTACGYVAFEGEETPAQFLRGTVGTRERGIWTEETDGNREGTGRGQEGTGLEGQVSARFARGTVGTGLWGGIGIIRRLRIIGRLGIIGRNGDYREELGLLEGSGTEELTGGIRVLESGDAVEGALYQTLGKHVRGRLDPSPWAKLYHRSLWEGLRFRECRYEDLDVFYRVWERAGRIAFLEECLLGYRQHEGSFLHQFSKSRLDALDVTDRIVEYYRGKGDERLERAARTRRFAAHWNMLLLLRKAVRRGEADNGEAREYEERCRRIIRESRGEVIRNGAARLKDRLGGIAGFMV